MIIKNKTQLRKVLHSGNFEKIIVWENGTWQNVGSNTSVENGMIGINIRHPDFYGVTHAQITERFAEIESAF